MVRLGRPALVFLAAVSVATVATLSLMEQLQQQSKPMSDVVFHRGPLREPSSPLLTQAARTAPQLSRNPTATLSSRAKRSMIQNETETPAPHLFASDTDHGQETDANGEEAESAPSERGTESKAATRDHLHDHGRRVERDSGTPRESCAPFHAAVVIGLRGAGLKTLLEVTARSVFPSSWRPITSCPLTLVTRRHARVDCALCRPIIVVKV